MDVSNKSKLTVTIFGKCNTGKSTLFNHILGTQTAIVSPVPGTTTDPVVKSMELLPYGPIFLIDTAGVSDESILGQQRLDKTKQILNRTDLALYTMTADEFNLNDQEFQLFQKEFEKRKIPVLLVVTKCDHGDIEIGDAFVKVSSHDQQTMNELKLRIAEELEKLNDENDRMLPEMIQEKGLVLLVVPIDSQAPKGRLILPQVQVIRECLDRSIRCNVTTLATLEEALTDARHIDLVITDSQLFQQVNAIVPIAVPLTSFSILLANQKGNLKELLDGAAQIANLQDGDKVLIAETCTHNRNHEDIGQVKIPNLLKKMTQKEISFHFSAGRDYPPDLETFALVVHCGGCMIGKKEMENRILLAQEKGVPITNYGLVLALGNQTLQRSVAIFNTK